MTARKCAAAVRGLSPAYLRQAVVRRGVHSTRVVPGACLHQTWLPDVREIAFLSKPPNRARRPQSWEPDRAPAAGRLPGPAVVSHERRGFNPQIPRRLAQCDHIVFRGDDHQVSPLKYLGLPARPVLVSFELSQRCFISAAGRMVQVFDEDYDSGCGGMQPQIIKVLFAYRYAVPEALHQDGDVESILFQQSPERPRCPAVTGWRSRDPRRGGCPHSPSRAKLSRVCLEITHGLSRRALGRIQPRGGRPHLDIVARTPTQAGQAFRHRFHKCECPLCEGRTRTARDSRPRAR